MKGKKRVERLEPRLSKLYWILKNSEEIFGTRTPSVRELLQAQELSEEELSQIRGDPSRLPALGPIKHKLSRVHGDLEKLVELGFVELLPIKTRRFRAVGPAPNKINWEELLLQL